MIIKSDTIVLFTLANLRAIEVIIIYQEVRNVPLVAVTRNKQTCLRESAVDTRFPVRTPGGATG